MSANTARLDEVFAAAAAETAPAARAAYLDQACADQPELRQRVEALLAAHDGAGSFLKLPAGDATTPFVLVSERPGSTIGRYKLLEQIGEGGFGVVFMAEQERPVRRRVALKVIKLGMDTKQVVARFEAERQALAMMDHPNIAKVFDAGATETGRPYFVMELVRGVPITEYCDQARLTADQRLGLFQSVCAAVQHAHQKGIIHRDLKPSNVLVTLHDDKAVPKVIDFGVAKATQARLTERTLFTEFRQMVGTPAYMSPEQAQMSGLDVDTRSDVYSLGVLLYELLTGSTPIDAKQLSSASYDGLRRLICEVDPPSPSARLATLPPAALTTLAGKRHCAPAELTISLRSDLDWIVMKCLEKDRSRRYESASALALDVQRYLDGQPVEARPPSTGYRLKKFVRRNRGAVMAGGLVAAAVVVGTAVAVWQAIRATRAETVAVAAADAEAAAKDAAEERQAELQAVLEFVESKIFVAARPEGQDGGMGHDVTLRAAVESALPFVETSFARQPLIEARLRMTVGLSFLYLGEAHIAAEQFQAARKLYARQLGPEDPSTIASMDHLAKCYAALGRSDEAAELRQQVFLLRTDQFGSENPDTLRSMSDLAISYRALGRDSDSLKLHEETLALRRKVLAPGHPDTIASMRHLAERYTSFGNHTEAYKLRAEVFELLNSSRSAINHFEAIDSMLYLAESHAYFGRHSEALQLREEALKIAQDKLPHDHSTTLRCMRLVAGSYTALGQYSQAVQSYNELLALEEPQSGNRASTELHWDLAYAYRSLGRFHEADEILDQADAMLTDSLRAIDPDQPRYARLLHDRAELRGRRGRWEEARIDLDEVMGIHPGNHWTFYKFATLLALVDGSAAYRELCHRALQQFGQTDDPNIAERTIKACLMRPWPDGDLEMLSKLADVATSVEPSHGALPFFEFAKGLAEFRRGNFESAADLMTRVIATNMELCSSQAYMALAMARYHLGDPAAAHATFVQGCQHINRNAFRLDADDLGVDWHDTIIVHVLLQEACEFFEQALEATREDFGPEDRRTLEGAYSLAIGYGAIGRNAEAEALLTDGMLIAAEDQPQRLGMLALRGDLRGRLGRWPSAAADLLKLAELHPDSNWAFHVLTPLLVQTGDVAAYRDQCLRALQRFGQTNDPYIAERTVKGCLILPWPEADFQNLSDLADVALAVDPSHGDLPFFEFAEGLLKFREGNFAAAARWMEKVLNAPALDFRNAQAALVLAMARHGLGEPEAARAAFEQGDQYFRTRLPRLDADEIGPHWVDMIIAHALHREAEALLGPDAP